MVAFKDPDRHLGVTISSTSVNPACQWPRGCYGRLRHPLSARYISAARSLSRVWPDASSCSKTSVSKTSASDHEPCRGGVGIGADEPGLAVPGPNESCFIATPCGPKELRAPLSSGHRVLRNGRGSPSLGSQSRRWDPSGVPVAPSRPCACGDDRAHASQTVAGIARRPPRALTIWLHPARSAAP